MVSPSFGVGLSTVFSVTKSASGGVLQEVEAVPALISLKTQAPSAEKVAVRSIDPPSAGSVTPTKVYGDVNPTTETELRPSPVNSNVPVKGALAKVTVTSAVNISSVLFELVLLSLQMDIFDVPIAVIIQGGGPINRLAETLGEVKVPVV